jgi:hypothetical protein
MDRIRELKEDNDEKIKIIKNYQKYLQAIYSVEDSIETRMIILRDDIQDERNKMEENLSFFKRLSNNLIE